MEQGRRPVLHKGVWTGCSSWNRVRDQCYTGLCVGDSSRNKVRDQC